MVHLITYDLKKPVQDYPSLHDSIKSYAYWAHPLESVWFVDTNKTIADVRDHLSKQIDSNDQIFVVQMHLNWGSWNFSKEVVEWLNSPNRTW